MSIKLLLAGLLGAVPNSMYEKVVLQLRDEVTKRLEAENQLTALKKKNDKLASELSSAVAEFTASAIKLDAMKRDLGTMSDVLARVPIVHAFEVTPIAGDGKVVRYDLEIVLTNSDKLWRRAIRSLAANKANKKTLETAAQDLRRFAGLPVN
jgi:hypothetical protein